MSRQGRVAKRVAKFPEYVFARLSREVARVERESGRRAMNFGPGSPDIVPSKMYLDKLAEFIREPKAHLYPGFGAIPEFSEALTGWYKRRFEVELEDGELLPLLGAKDGVSHLPLALADEGDEVLMPDPGYPAYAGATLMVGAKVVTYDLTEKNRFKVEVEAVEKKVTDKTKYMWVNFPGNPTGQVVRVNELALIVEFCRRRGLWLIYDNAYSEITFGGVKAPSVLEVEGAKEVAVELGSFSKTFSLAGYRMGWMVGNREVIEALAKVKSQMDSGLSRPLQRLGAYALDNFDSKWHGGMLESYGKRREIIAAKLKKLGLAFELPKGALYIWARIPETEKDSESFCMRLLEERQVLLTPGTAFGENGKGYVRVSVCIDIGKIDEYL